MTQKFVLTVPSKGIRRPVDDDIVMLPRAEIVRKIETYQRLIGFATDDRVIIQGNKGAVIVSVNGNIETIIDNYM